MTLDLSPAPLGASPRNGPAAVTKFTLTVKCPSTRGIVAAIATYLAERGCNIIDAAQFDDILTGNFFTRISFEPETGATLPDLIAGFGRVAEPFAMDFAFHDEARRKKAVIMVSRFGHCLNDLLYRWRIGALPIDIVAVISNHLDYQKLVVNHDIPFHHVKVSRDSKARRRGPADGDHRGHRRRTGHPRPLHAGPVRRDVPPDAGADHQHPPFLPAQLQGANPYKQAYERGVKLIGATSHYVTANLDEGPIIEQDTIRVTHAQSAEDYVSLGRDVESAVLARAIHAHIHNRVFLNGNKTVVFPASPGSYASERMG